MKTNYSTRFSPLALVAALASLLLCSCVSNDLLQRKAFLMAQTKDDIEYYSPPLPERIVSELRDVNAEIYRERVRAWIWPAWSCKPCLG